jgi:hypothetical protein
MSEPRALARLALTALVLLAGVAGGLASPRQPGPLHGVPLGHSTGLRLVVAAVPPLVLDVDSGRVRRVSGVPAQRRGVLWVVGVSGRAAIVVAESVWQHARLYAVDGRRRVSSLGMGADVVPDAGGRSVWIESLVSSRRCTLRRVALDGRILRSARPFPCAATIAPGGSAGVIVNRTRVIDPATGRTVFRTGQGIVAVAGERLVLSSPGRRLTLVNGATGARRGLRWPSVLTGLDEPAVDPHGRYVALGFADPAWQGRQALDVWILDLKTGELEQLPGLPATLALKWTSTAWTDDGRLVLLAQPLDRDNHAGPDVVAVWRPGWRRLAVKTVHLPGRSLSGSDSFAPLG